MSGKLNFGCDYLHIMREYINRGDASHFNPVSDAAARMFLLDWGFSIEENDQVNKLFWEKVENKTLGDLGDAIKRVVEYASKDRMMQERLVIQLAAIGDLDNKITDDENRFIHFFQDRFDFKPSEFSALTVRGIEISIALLFFGDAYKKLREEN